MFDDGILSKYFSNMNNNDSNKDSSESLGNSGLQQQPYPQDLAEIGNSTLIHIPFYFENNNVI
jgi:hypothetical protein